MSRDDWIYLVLALTIVVGFFIVILIFSYAYEKDIASQEKRDDVCRNIGEKKSLEFFEQGYGRCGWGVECSYQCKFLNKNGDVVIKNVD